MIKGHEDFLDAYCSMADIQFSPERRNLLLAELTRYHIQQASHILHSHGGWYIEQTEYKGFTPTIIAFNNIHEPNRVHDKNKMDKPTFISIKQAVDTVTDDIFNEPFLAYFTEILNETERNESALHNLHGKKLSDIFKTFISIVGCTNTFDVHIKENERQTPGSILVGGSVASAAARGLNEATHIYDQNREMYMDSKAVLILEQGILESMNFSKEELEYIKFTTEKTDIKPLIKGFGPLPFSLISF
jgi:hypothetical protein